jgi:carbamoyl-phosphate synthase large subunit
MRNDAFVRDKSHFTVLLTSPDSNVILVNALREAAKSAELNLKIVACDQRPRKSPASLLSDAAYELPPRSAAHYLQAIIDVCVIHRVDLVLPLASLDVALLTRNQKSFEAIGVAVAVCGKPLLLAASRWSRSARRRRQIDDLDLPIVESQARFRIVLYFDRAGELQTIIPCELLVDAGVEHLVTKRDSRVIESIRSKLGPIRSAQSIVTLDACIDECGELMIEHVRLDLADTIEIAHKAGAQLVRWLLQEQAGLDAAPNDDWREGVEMLRYSAAMYLLPT